MEVEVGVMYFKDGGKPRNAGGLQELEKARTYIPCVISKNRKEFPQIDKEHIPKKLYS